MSDSPPHPPPPPTVPEKAVTRHKIRAGKRPATIPSHLLPPASLPPLKPLPRLPTSKPLAKLSWFGLSLNHLPTGVSQSSQHPLVSPIPLALGIHYCPPGTNPDIHVVHITRHNPFNPMLPQIYKTLSEPSARNEECPSTRDYMDSNRPILFLAPAPCSIAPLQVEILGKLTAEDLVKRTGRRSVDGSQEYIIHLGIKDMAKMCSGCGRWEALVQRMGMGDIKEKRISYKYRRWRTCAGCEETWFCRNECFMKAWEAGHWMVCGERKMKRKGTEEDGTKQGEPEEEGKGKGKKKELPENLKKMEGAWF